MDFLRMIFLFVAASAVVSLAMAAVVRSNALCVAASTITAELLLDLYILSATANSRDQDMVLLAVNVNALIGTPVMLVSSIISVAWARRFCRRCKGVS